MALFKKKAASDNPKEIWEDFFRVVMKNEWKKALEYIYILKDLEPDNPQVHMKMGDILQRTGETQGAVAAYHQAAWCLENAEDYSKAIAIFKIILRLNPNDQDAMERSQALMGGAVQGQAQQHEHMTYEEATGEGGEYIDESSEGDGQYEEETAYEPAYEEEPQSSAVTADSEYTDETSAAPELYETPPEDASAPAPEPSLKASPSPESSAGDKASAKPKGLHDAFKRHPIFKVLSDEDIDTMITKASHKVFKDGEPVINEDETGDSMFIIKKGQALVTSTMLSQTYKLATLGGGNFFGEVGFLTGMPRTATVTSKGGLSIMEINKALMQELIERNPMVLQKLVELSHSRTHKKQQIRESKD